MKWIDASQGGPGGRVAAELSALPGSTAARA